MRDLRIGISHTVGRISKGFKSYDRNESHIGGIRMLLWLLCMSAGWRDEGEMV